MLRKVSQKLHENTCYEVFCSKSSLSQFFIKNFAKFLKQITWHVHVTLSEFPAGIYLLKVNRNARTSCGICSKLTMKTEDQGSYVNFKNNSLVLNTIHIAPTLRNG